MPANYGTQTKNGATGAATLGIQLKATGNYTLTVQTGTGPANLTTIVAAFFRSTHTTTATLAAGSADTIELDLKLKGGTPLGTYGATLLVTKTASGSTATIPISLIRGWRGLRRSRRHEMRKKERAGGPGEQEPPARKAYWPTGGPARA
ncbi:MAG TPA: hypothetical protein VHG53_01465 [Candidatus Limnocylindria bacterium]|nr:hypothetical protein [Candidatus Limnocylindria bacterium]